MPAALGIERTHGTVAVGKVANLIVTDGDLFTQDATIRDVWVQGARYGVQFRQPQVEGPRDLGHRLDRWDRSNATLVLEGPLNRVPETSNAKGVAPSTSRGPRDRRRDVSR